MRFTPFSLALLLGTGVLAEVDPRATATVEPCGILATASASYYASQPTSSRFLMNATTAYSCLSSVPIDTERDIELLDYLVPYIEFHSTLAFLKTPTADYLMPGIDVLGGIATIREKLVNGTYKGQYEFIVDLQSIYINAHDGHFWYNSILNKVFVFQTQYSLVSVSTDGVSLPKIYTPWDAWAIWNKYKGNYSELVSIDGVPVTDVIERIGSVSAEQDPDALYNTALYSIASNALSRGNSFYGGSYQWLPNTYTYKFANGSIEIAQNVAFTSKNLTGIRNGNDIHTKFELPAASSSSSTADARNKRAAATSVVGAATPTPPGHNYPTPAVQNTDGWLSGYFLSDTKYQDTAVLAVQSFATEANNVNDTKVGLEVQSVLKEFFGLCRAHNRTKLVIDLQSNGGGQLSNGFELFKQLFPSLPVWWPMTGRAVPFLDFAGNETSVADAEGSADFLDADGKNFSSWEAFFGPMVVNGDNFTNFLQYDMNNVSNFKYFVTGYGTNAANLPAQPFSADNIVIITDGVCHSTCTTFLGMATRRAGVRTIAYGGRPKAQPMQAMGGVKGGTSLNFAAIQEAAGELLNMTNGKIPEAYQATYPNISQPPLLPAMNSKDYNFNFRNAHLNFSYPVPAQFIYEAAHCKQFFTFATVNSIVNLWESAVDIAWYGAKCVAGSTTNADDTIGNATVPFSPQFKADWNMYSGGPGFINPNTTATATTGVVTATGTSSATASPSKSNAAGILEVSTMGGLPVLAAMAALAI